MEEEMDRDELIRRLEDLRPEFEKLFRQSCAGRFGRKRQERSYPMSLSRASRMFPSWTLDRVRNHHLMPDPMIPRGGWNQNALRSEHPVPQSCPGDRQQHVVGSSTYQCFFDREKSGDGQ